jgi:hypothetical protein
MLARRLGLPHLRGAESFVLATLIDMLGTGLFLPFSLLYFHRALVLKRQVFCERLAALHLLMRMAS